MSCRGKSALRRLLGIGVGREAWAVCLGKIASRLVREGFGVDMTGTTSTTRSTVVCEERWPNKQNSLSR